MAGRTPETMTTEALLLEADAYAKLGSHAPSMMEWLWRIEAELEARGILK